MESRKEVLLSYYLDKGFEVPYFISEWGRIAGAKIINKEKRPVHILSFGVQFDWEEEEYLWWRKLCSIELAPGDEKALPDIDFRISIDAEPKAHTYRLGVKLEEFRENKWIGPAETVFELNHILIEEHPRRDFMVFISHSNHPDDETLTNLTHDLLENCGIDAYVAEKKGELGVLLWPKIKKRIKASDAIMVLWTKHGAESRDIREEIGIAIGMEKYDQIIPVVEEGEELAGALKGKEWDTLDRRWPNKALIEAIEKILIEAEKKHPLHRPVGIK